MSEKGREVVVRLKLTGDGPASQKAAQEMVRSATNAQKKVSSHWKQIGKEIDKENERIHAARAKLAREEERENDRIHHRHRERQRSMAAANRAAREAESRDAIRAAKASETAQVKAANASTAAQVRLAGAFVAGARGAAGVARGVALIGIASEKDMEKAIRAFAKIEAGIQIMAGIYTAVRAGTEAWKAYKNAVLAAAAAQALAGRTGAGAAVGAGAAGVAGAGGGLIGRAAAAGGGVGGLLRAGGGMLGGGALTAGRAAVPLIGGLALGEGLSRIATGGRTGTVTEAIGAWRDRTNAQNAARRTAFMEGQGRVDFLRGLEQRETDQGRWLQEGSAKYGSLVEERGIMARRGKTGAAADVASLRAQIEKSRQVQGYREAHAGFMPGDDGGDELAQDRLRFAQEQLGLQKELREAQMRAHQEQIDEIDERISKTRTAKQAADDLFKSEQQRLQSAEERLASLNVVEVAALKAAKAKADAGGVLTRDETNSLRGVGLFEEQVRRQDRLAVQRNGAGDLLDEQRARVRSAAAESAKLTFDLATQLTAKVKLETDAEDLAQQLSEQLIPMLREVAAKQQQALDESARRAIRNDGLKTAEAVATGG